MNDLSTSVLRPVLTLALPLAFIANPWLLARTLAPRFDALATLTLAALLSVCLNALAPLALHLSIVPITPVTLAALHGFLALILAAAQLIQHRPIGIRPSNVPLPLGLLIALFALLVLPVTHLAGIDTYKWQDLATNVIVEERIPWLTHPLALFGYASPRAYPGLQPLLLASAELLGGLGVDWGFFVVSLASGALGALTIHRLASTFSPRRSTVLWVALFYVLSPVFVRYNHWATGRGILMALFPLFILALLRLPRPRAIPSAIALALLLAFSHKTGLIAVALTPPLLLLCALFRLPVKIARGLASTALLTALALAVILAAAPVGSLAGFWPAGFLAALVAAPIVRFGVILPFAAAGIVLAIRSLPTPRWGLAVAGVILTLPLALFEMYGALLALPFLALCAGRGMEWALPSTAPAIRLFSAAIASIVLASALIVILHRSLDATPAAVYRAARFLEAHDPAGPYQVVAPDRLRSRIQAYVSGCPRFPAALPTPADIRWQPPPPASSSLRNTLASRVHWLRNIFSGAGAGYQWYGDVRTLYYITQDGHGDRPPDARPIYSRDGIEIHALPVRCPPGRVAP